MQVGGPHQGGENRHSVYGQSRGSGEAYPISIFAQGLNPSPQILVTILGSTQNLSNTNTEDFFQRTLLEFRKDGARPKEVSALPERETVSNGTR